MTTMSPPAALPEPDAAPPVTSMLPDCPVVEAPVDRVRDPVLPVDAAPVASVVAPLTPAALPPLAVKRVRVPEEDCVL